MLFCVAGSTDLKACHYAAWSARWLSELCGFIEKMDPRVCLVLLIAITEPESFTKVSREHPHLKTPFLVTSLLLWGIAAVMPTNEWHARASDVDRLAPWVLVPLISCYLASCVPGLEQLKQHHGMLNTIMQIATELEAICLKDQPLLPIAQFRPQIARLMIVLGTVFTVHISWASYPWVVVLWYPFLTYIRRQLQDHRGVLQMGQAQTKRAICCALLYFCCVMCGLSIMHAHDITRLFTHTMPGVVSRYSRGLLGLSPGQQHVTVATTVTVVTVLVYVISVSLEQYVLLQLEHSDSLPTSNRGQRSMREPTATPQPSNPQPANSETGRPGPASPETAGSETASSTQDPQDHRHPVLRKSTCLCRCMPVILLFRALCTNFASNFFSSHIFLSSTELGQSSSYVILLYIVLGTLWLFVVCHFQQHFCSLEVIHSRQPRNNHTPLGKFKAKVWCSGVSSTVIVDTLTALLVGRCMSSYARPWYFKNDRLQGASGWGVCIGSVFLCCFGEIINLHGSGWSAIICAVCVNISSNIWVDWSIKLLKSDVAGRFVIVFIALVSIACTRVMVQLEFVSGGEPSGPVESDFMNKLCSKGFLLGALSEVCVAVETGALWQVVSMWYNNDFSSIS